MTNLTPTPAFQDVPQLETNTLALAGPGNPMNSQAQALLNRTEFINDKVDDAAESLSASGGSSTVGFTQGGAGAYARTVQDKLRETASIEDFGAIGDGVTNNDVAFSNCEASTILAFFVPEGNFRLTNPGTLQKRYYGPGLLNGNGLDDVPGNFARWSSPIIPIPQQGYPYYWQGDTSKSNQEFYIIDNIRTRIGESYYCGQTTPHMQRLDNRSGFSGILARTTIGASVGDISVILNSIDGFSVGDQIGFGSISQSLTDICTVTSISTSPIAIGLSVPLTNAYPVGTAVTIGLRTMNTIYHQQLDHRGGGDGYCMLFRIEASYASKQGQDHFYFTSTAGPGGGDVVASSDHVYLSGWEFTFDGTTKDAAAIGDIRSYLRNVNTAARHEVWIDRVALSSGSVACDVGYEVAGKWKCGIDLARADFSTNGNNAIGLSAEQRIYFNNTVVDPTNPYPLWANNNGDTYMHYQTLNSRFKIVVGGVTALNLSSSGASVVGLESGASGVSVPSSAHVALNGLGGNTYLTYNGTNILLFKNGVQVASW